MDAIGFHRFNEALFKEDEYDFGEFYYDAQNVLNVLGWFPGLGTPIGIIRITSTIYMIVTDEKSHKGSHQRYYFVSIVRGVLEILGLGFLFVIPDIIFSFRSRKKKFNKKLKKKIKKLKKKKSSSSSSSSSSSFSSSD